MHFARTILLIALISILCDSIYAQGGVNTQLIGQLRTHGTTGYSNCWGYVAPNGKEYAILGCFTGTQIVDISSDTLKEVAFITGPSSDWREMKVYQKYAYIVTEGSGAGLQIIDLDSMKLVNTINTTQVPTGHTVSIEGKYLYVNGGKYKSGGIVVLDLTNPVNPVYVGEYETQYVHDCVIKNDTIYAAAIYGQGIDIIDATNKANIKRISITNYPYSGTHNTDLTTNKKYVLSTDEINSNPDHNGNLLRVWDRTDVTNLKLVATYVARPQTIVHNIHVKGNFGYLAHYSEGVRILDLKYPDIPVEVGYYDSFVGSANNYVGAWGTFPYYNSNKVIISDISGGLFVFRFAGQDGSIKVARTIMTIKDSTTNLPISGVKVSIPGRFDTLFTDSDGKIKFGSTLDTITITMSKSTYNSGYPTKQEKILMKYDSVLNSTVYLKPSLAGSLTSTVTNKITSKPVKNFILKIPNTPVVGNTDSTGKFIIPALLGGNKYFVVASQWGFVAETTSVVIVGGTNNTVSFQLTPNGLDDFELDRSWVVGSPADSGKTGMWERAKPNAAVVGLDTLQPNEDHSPKGTICFVTGSSSGANEYVDYRTTVTSPSFSLAEMTNPSLLYWIFFNSRSAVKDDTLYVELSNDNGKTWKVAQTVSGKQPFWKQYRIDVKSIMNPTEAMRIRFIAMDGGVSTVFDAAFDDVEFGENLQLTVEANASNIPKDYTLSQNYPNPFNPSTTISYQLPVDNLTSLKVYDVLGREVADLMNEMKERGNYSVAFNASKLSSGIYFYTLRSGSFTATKKLMLIK